MTCFDVASEVVGRQQAVADPALGLIVVGVWACRNHGVAPIEASPAVSVALGAYLDWRALASFCSTCWTSFGHFAVSCESDQAASIYSLILSPIPNALRQKSHQLDKPERVIDPSSDTPGMDTLQFPADRAAASSSSCR